MRVRKGARAALAVAVALPLAALGPAASADDGTSETPSATPTETPSPDPSTTPTFGATPSADVSSEPAVTTAATEDAEDSGPSEPDEADAMDPGSESSPSDGETSAEEPADTAPPRVDLSAKRMPRLAIPWLGFARQVTVTVTAPEADAAYDPVSVDLRFRAREGDALSPWALSLTCGADAESADTPVEVTSGDDGTLVARLLPGDDGVVTPGTTWRRTCLVASPDKGAVRDVRPQGPGVMDGFDEDNAWMLQADATLQERDGGAPLDGSDDVDFRVRFVDTEVRGVGGTVAAGGSAQPFRVAMENQTYEAYSDFARYVVLVPMDAKDRPVDAAGHLTLQYEHDDRQWRDAELVHYEDDHGPLAVAELPRYPLYGHSRPLTRFRLAADEDAPAVRVGVVAFAAHDGVALGFDASPEVFEVHGTTPVAGADDGVDASAESPRDLLAGARERSGWVPAATPGNDGDGPAPGGGQGRDAGGDVLADTGPGALTAAALVGGVLAATGSVLTVSARRRRGLTR